MAGLEFAGGYHAVECCFSRLAYYFKRRDFREGGSFCSRMEAKDGSMGFDFSGTYTKIRPQQLIEYVMSDERAVTTKFSRQAGKIKVVTTFDAEGVHDAELQRQGWQSILDNFVRYVESQKF